VVATPQVATTTAPEVPQEVQAPQPQAGYTRRKPNILPGAANFTPVNDKVMAQMWQNLAPQKNGTPMYAPGVPIRPIPGITPDQGPRQYAYELGYNIAQLPRGTEEYNFDELRYFAKTLDVIQLCEQVWFDYISKLEMVIEPRPELIDEDMDISEYEADIQYYKDFFASPDKEHDLHEWLQMLVRDQLEIDAVAIFVRKNRAGGVYSLDVIDGATLKPLIDDRGRKPQPPFPAYEQFVYGVPAAFLLSDDLIYVKEVNRSDSQYGLSRVEKIILRIAMALRKQSKDLARFTDGSIPAGVVEQSMDVQWTQEEVEDYEQDLNDNLGGNDVARARVKVLPKGFSYKSTDDPDVHIDLDMFIINIAAADFGLAMDELAITDNSNKSVGQSQENVVYRRAMQPLMNRYAKLFTMILRKYFKENRFIVKWKGFEEHEDFNVKSQAFIGLTNAGIQSPTQSARALNLPVWNDEEIPPFVMTKTGPIMLEDLANPELRKAQMDAQLAGLQLAKQNPGSKAPGDSQDGQGDGEEEEDAQEDTQDAKPSKSNPSASTRTSVPDVSSEYKRWRTVALNDIKAGKPIRQFTSDSIPNMTLAMGHLALQQCQTPEAVKNFFNAMRSQVYA
jgi:hypothetical protein